MTVALVAVSILGGTTTIAHAQKRNRVYSGTPKVMRGNWKTKYHKMGDGYYRHKLIANKKMFYFIEYDYNHKHHYVTNGTGFGIEHRTKNVKLSKGTTAYKIMVYWNIDYQTKVTYRIKLSRNHHKMSLYSGSQTPNKRHLIGTFYK